MIILLGQNDSAATITQNKTNEVTYALSFNEPGQFYEFTVGAKNDGTIDGMINAITSTIKIGNGEATPITTNPSNLPSYMSYSATYSDGTPIEQYHLLQSNQKETYKVRVEFRTDIEATDLPETDETIELTFGVEYVQKNSNGVSVHHPFTGTKYTTNIWDGNNETWHDGTNNTMVWIGRSITNNITQYDNAQDAMNALKLASGNVDRPFYLKHSIVNDIVTESYVEFIVTDGMATNNEGMVAGTYTLRGAGGTNCVYDNNNSKWNCDSYSPYYEANVNTIKTAFGYSTHPERCNTDGQAADGSLYFNCSVSGLYANSLLPGHVSAIDGSWNCDVTADDISMCDQVKSGGGFS